MPKTTTRRNLQGFTLVELVMVILLMAIIAAIAVSRFSGSLADLQAAGIARQITQDIATVRRVARVTSTTKSISFDAADQTYTLHGVINPDRRIDAYPVLWLLTRLDTSGPNCKDLPVLITIIRVKAVA